VSLITPQDCGPGGGGSLPPGDFADIPPAEDNEGMLYYAEDQGVIYRSDGATWQVYSSVSAGGPPTGAAGGDLGGGYPNPTLSAAKEAELDAAAAAAAAALAAANEADDTADAAQSTATAAASAASAAQASANTANAGVAAIIDGYVSTGQVEAPSFKADGKTGAGGVGVVLGGSTVGGAPASGTHVVGELVWDDANGRMLRCSVAGSPGTFVDVYGNLVTASIATHNADAAAHTAAFAAFSEGLPQFSQVPARDNLVLYDEFMGGNTTSGAVGSLGWSTAVVGTGAVTLPSSDQDDPGFVTLGVPALNDTIEMFLDGFSLKGCPAFIWESRIKVANLNGGGSEFTFRAGIATTSTIGPADGLWFQYDQTDASWSARVDATASAPQTTDTGVDVVANTWYYLTIVCDGGGAAFYYIDDVLVATYVSGLPVAGTVMAPRFGSRKTLGAATRNVRVGSFYLKWALAR
jgi:hypothetical protein